MDKETKYFLYDYGGFVIGVVGDYPNNKKECADKIAIEKAIENGCDVSLDDGREIHVLDYCSLSGFTKQIMI